MQEEYNEFGFSILRKLNEVYLEFHPEILTSDYRNKCKEIFNNLEFDNNISLIKNDLLKRFKYKQIEYIDDPSMKDITEDTIISFIINGKIQITSYGRTQIDGVFINAKIENERNKLIAIFEKERDNIENIKSNLIGQVFTLMAVFVAIITFIFQGISLVTNTSFINSCFIRQLQVTIALYLPLFVVI